MLLGIFSSLCVQMAGQMLSPTGQQQNLRHLYCLVATANPDPCCGRHGAVRERVRCYFLSLAPLLNVNAITEQVCCQPKTAKIQENNDVEPPSLCNSQRWMNPQCVVKDLDHFNK